MFHILDDNLSFVLVVARSRMFIPVFTRALFFLVVSLSWCFRGLQDGVVFVAQRLFLNQAVSWRDVTPFRAAGSVGKRASGCKSDSQQQPSPFDEDLLYVPLLFEDFGGCDGMWAFCHRLHMLAQAESATSCLQQTWGCVQRLLENYCMEQDYSLCHFLRWSLISPLITPPGDSFTLTEPLS